MAKVNIPQFDTAIGQLTIEQARRTWVTWKRHLDVLRSDNSIAPIIRKHHLLATGGKIISDIDMAVGIVIDEPTGDAFEDLVKKIDKFLIQDEASKMHARVQFRRVIQRSDEAIDEYFLRLQTAIHSCAWSPDEASKELCDQLKSHGLPRTIMSKLVIENADINKILDQIRVYEAAVKEQNASINQQSRPAIPIAVMEVSDRRPRYNQNQASGSQRRSLNNSSDFRRSHNRGAPCKGCGKNCFSRQACPAYSTACRYCNLMGHLEKVCLKKQKDQLAPNSRKRPVNHVCDDDDFDDSPAQVNTN